MAKKSTDYAVRLRSQTGDLPMDARASSLSGMTVVADLGESGVWYELLSQQDANRASILSETAVHIYFAKEESQEGGHPRRWFAFVRNVGEDARADVCVAAIRPGAKVENPGLIPSGVHATGYRNANPYPDFANEIERLAEVTGLAIEPNWQGHPLPPAPSP